MKVGDEVKGFKFEASLYPYFNKCMNLYVGRKGVVKSIDTSLGFFKIEFEDYAWNYPLSLAHLAIPWQPKQGEMIEVRDDGTEWIERVFIAKHKDKFVFETLHGDVCIWKHARPINTIQREIDDLKERIKELECRL